MKCYYSGGDLSSALSVNSFYPQGSSVLWWFFTPSGYYSDDACIGHCTISRELYTELMSTCDEDFLDDDIVDEIFADHLCTEHWATVDTAEMIDCICSIKEAGELADAWYQAHPDSLIDDCIAYYLSDKVDDAFSQGILDSDDAPDIDYLDEYFVNSKLDFPTFIRDIMQQLN